MAGDATVVPMLGKAGNPNRGDRTTARRSINVDAGHYIRTGNRGGYSKEDATQLREQGKKGSRLIVWEDAFRR